MKTRTSLSLMVVTLGLLLSAQAVTPVGAKDLRDWGVKIDKASSRFKVLKAFNNEAVLDKETQLVWERSPRNTFTWLFARNCSNRTIGNRKGWRLPSAHELGSLIDPGQNNPALPTGHPFDGVLSGTYWSATTSAINPNRALELDFSFGRQFENDKSASNVQWCVRGGSPGPDTY